MNPSPSPQELAEEARRALEAAPLNSRELIEFLIARGIIDSSGRVLVARLFGENETDQKGGVPSDNGAAVPGTPPPADRQP